MVNVYRGATMGSVYSDYSAVSSKPFVFSEYGYDDWDARILPDGAENQLMQMKSNLQLSAEIERHSVFNTLNGGVKSSVVCGGFLFQFVDHLAAESAGNSSAYDAFPGKTSNGPDGQADEEYRGLVSVGSGTPNQRIPKAAYYAIQDMWTTCQYPDPQRGNNQFQNAGFDWDLIGWSRKGWVDADWDTSDSQLNITNIQATAAGATTDLQIYQTGLDLSNTTHTYNLSFKAKTNVVGEERDINYYMVKTSGSWPPFTGAGKKMVHLTSDWQTFTTTFVPSSSFAGSAKMVLEFGAQNTSFVLDDFQLDGIVYGDPILSECTQTVAPTPAPTV
jgi:hypothetical protein